MQSGLFMLYVDILSHDDLIHVYMSYLHIYMSIICIYVDAFGIKLAFSLVMTEILLTFAVHLFP